MGSSVGVGCTGIRIWLRDLQSHCNPEVKVILVGNKSDFPWDRRVVKQEEAEAVAAEHDIPYIETSAKLGQ